MSFDIHKNFAITTVTSAPTPAMSGTTLVVDDATVFPAAPFNVTIWPINLQPVATNAEIARVTAIASNTLTIVRAQESSSARAILVGDQVCQAITKKALTDVEALAAATSTITTTGTQIALTLPTGSGPLIIFANNATALTIQGITAGTDGQRLLIWSEGAGAITLVHQSGSATAANRLINFDSADVVLTASNGLACLVYDITAARWKMESAFPVPSTLGRIKYFYEDLNAIGSSSTALTFDLGIYNNFTTQLTGNVGTTTISNVPASGKFVSFTVRTKGDGSARTWTWFTSTVKWSGGTAPTLTSTNNKFDWYSFISVDGGSTWAGFILGQNMDA